MSIAYADFYQRAIKNGESKKQLISIAKERRLLPSITIPLSILIFIAMGAALACRAEVLAILVSTGFIAVAKIWAWYLSHDCAHNSVFRSKRANTLLGECLSALNGLSFFSFDDYRKDHNRHHAEKIDLTGFDSKRFSKNHPELFEIIAFLERLYIPAYYYLIKISNVYQAIVSGGRHGAVRAIVSSCLYAVMFTAFAWISMPLVLVWLVASIARIHVVRFVDCFQHSYQQVPPQDDGVSNDKLYEIQNTFSVPVARRLTFLNLIILNFGYHTAHHCFPTCPWYMLPTLERRITEQLELHDEVRSLREKNYSFTQFLVAYHRNHLLRMISDDEGRPYDANGSFSIQHFTGAYTDKLLG